MKKLIALCASVVLLGAGCASTSHQAATNITVTTDKGAAVEVQIVPSDAPTQPVVKPVGKTTNIAVPNPGGVSPTNSEDRVVVFDGNVFNPQNVAVHVGRKITWKNTSRQDVWPAADPASSPDIKAAFDAKAPIHPGQEWSFTFMKAGNFPYHNYISNGSSGVVSVTPVGK